MRALFTLLAGVGSLHPLLPLAQAARDAGREVAFCSSRSFGGEIKDEVKPLVMKENAVRAIGLRSAAAEESATTPTSRSR